MVTNSYVSEFFVKSTSQQLIRSTMKIIELDEEAIVKNRFALCHNQNENPSVGLPKKAGSAIKLGQTINT
jgi:hypothetical protein